MERILSRRAFLWESIKLAKKISPASSFFADDNTPGVCVFNGILLSKRAVFYQGGRNEPNTLKIYSEKGPLEEVIIDGMRNNQIGQDREDMYIRFVGRGRCQKYQWYSIVDEKGRIFNNTTAEGTEKLLLGRKLIRKASRRYNRFLRETTSIDSRYIA